jgi:hypothetical protein
MSAIAVTQYRVKPNRTEDFVAWAKEMKVVAARHGMGRHLYMSILAGPNVGTYTMTAEAEDLAALGTGLQNLFADPAFHALQSRFIGPDGDGMATMLSLSQATEVPI